MLHAPRFLWIIEFACRADYYLTPENCQLDLRILHGGTAYQTDAGMCGDYDSVIGMEKQAAMDRFLGRGNTRLSVALGPVTLAGIIVETDNAGLATAVYPLRRGGVLAKT